MAKARSIIKLSGTIGNITYVNSKRYGFHARAAIGTYSPITLADGMKISSSEQSKANLMAKIIFDAVNEFAPGFKDGVFWSRLLKIFRAQQKVGDVISYRPFEKMEVRMDYPASNHGIFTLGSGTNPNEMILDCSFFNTKTPHGFSLSILRVATDETFLFPYPPYVAITSVKNQPNHTELVLEFPQLPLGTNCLYVLKCERVRKGQVEGTLQGMGVSFLKVV